MLVYIITSIMHGMHIIKLQAPIYDSHRVGLYPHVLKMPQIISI